MITAKQANFESKNRRTINEIKNELERNILPAIEEGKFDASCPICLDTPDDIRIKLCQELSELGYQVTITDLKQEEANMPIDQRSRYDVVYIKWDKGDM